MPNWVRNILTFNNESDCEKVWKGILKESKQTLLDILGNQIINTKQLFSFETVIPTPKTIEECPQEYIKTESSCIQEDKEKPWFDWYAWNCDFWGVKWDACDACMYDREIIFDTPWCPPCDSVFEAIAEKFNVNFTQTSEFETYEHIINTWG